MFKNILASLFSGKNSIIEKVGNVVDKFVTTKEEKAQIKLELSQALHKAEIEVRELTHKEVQAFNQRIKNLEGTASDLIQAGFFGKVILFARGAQRPLWGYATMYFNWKYFNGDLVLSDKGEQLLYIIDVLVLGFIFGERAVKNILPLIRQFLEQRQVNKQAKQNT